MPGCLNRAICVNAWLLLSKRVYIAAKSNTVEDIEQYIGKLVFVVLEDAKEVIGQLITGNKNELTVDVEGEGKVAIGVNEIVEYGLA